MFLRSIAMFAVLIAVGVPAYWAYWVTIAHDALSLLLL